MGWVFHWPKPRNFHPRGWEYSQPWYPWVHRDTQILGGSSDQQLDNAHSNIITMSIIQVINVHMYKYCSILIVHVHTSLEHTPCFCLSVFCDLPEKYCLHFGNQFRPCVFYHLAHLLKHCCGLHWWWGGGRGRCCRSNWSRSEFSISTTENNVTIFNNLDVW